MEKTGFIEIRITGTKGNLDLTPDTYDIREVMAVLEQVEGLLFPADKKERPTISYQIQGGSVRHISDSESQKVYGLLRSQNASPKFEFLNLNTSPSEAFGILDLR